MTTPECNISEDKKCCPCRKLPALFLVLFGFTFLLREAGFISQHVAGLIWPCLVILAGAQFMFGHLCKCCKTE